MHITEKRTDIIIESLQDAGHITDSASTYGEPGYTDPDQGILIGNWNGVSERVGGYLEDAGFDLQYYDEWTVDYNTSKAYRTQADSYHWVPQIMLTDGGEILTPDDEVQDWIDECEITDQAQTATGILPQWIGADDIIACGYTLADDDIRHGWYGREDDPKTIQRKLFAIDDVTSVVYQVAGAGQFESRFKAYVKIEA